MAVARDNVYNISAAVNYRNKGGIQKHGRSLTPKLGGGGGGGGEVGGLNNNE